jgi:hypothetical protein
MPGLDIGTARGVARRFLSDIKQTSAACRAANFSFAHTLLLSCEERAGRLSSELFNVNIVKRLKQSQKAQILNVYSKANLSKTGSFFSVSLKSCPTTHYYLSNGEMLPYPDVDYSFNVDAIDIIKSHVNIDFYNLPVLVSTHAWRQWLVRSGLSSEDMVSALIRQAPIMSLYMSIINDQEAEKPRAIQVVIPVENGIFVGFCRLVKSAHIGNFFDVKCASSKFCVRYSLGDGHPEMMMSLCIRSYIDNALLENSQTEYVAALMAWISLYKDEFDHDLKMKFGLKEIDNMIKKEFIQFQEHANSLFGSTYRRALFEMEFLPAKDVDDPLLSSLTVETEKKGLASIHDLSVFMSVPAHHIKSKVMKCNLFSKT